MSARESGRRTSPSNWFRYRGGLGMVMWALHRVTGLGILLFLLLHVVDIFLLTFGEEVFNELLVIYTSPWARVMEVFLLFGFLFHALNGLRIAVQDFWPAAWTEEGRLIALQLTVFVIAFVPAAWLMLQPLFE
jgi:succinate dehydrogenase / fumarate reductase cytochrome b subunit